MSYDFATGWTTAIICGDGAIRSSYSLWSHPLFLPAVLLGNYCQRIEIRARTLERSLLDCEDNLGVTIAGATGQNLRSQTEWPKNVEVRKTTIDLHSTNAQIIFMLRVCDWARRYSNFLQPLDLALEQEDSLKVDREQRNQLEGIDRFHRERARGHARFLFLHARKSSDSNWCGA